MECLFNFLFRIFQFFFGVHSSAFTFTCDFSSTASSSSPFCALILFPIQTRHHRFSDWGARIHFVFSVRTAIPYPFLVWLNPDLWLWLLGDYCFLSLSSPLLLLLDIVGYLVVCIIFSFFIPLLYCLCKTRKLREQKLWFLPYFRYV